VRGAEAATDRRWIAGAAILREGLAAIRPFAGDRFDWLRNGPFC
jgi:hypothetical protein